LPRRKFGDETYYYGTTLKNDWKTEVISESYVDTSKLSQRAFSWQYPSAYFNVFREFYESYRSDKNQIRGFAYCLNPTTFLLVPTIDKLDMPITCFVQPGQKLPDEHAYVEVKGHRRFFSEKNKVVGYSVFSVDDFQTVNMNLDIIKPDISFKDFEGLLFDNWNDVSSEITDSIGLSMVSSPADFYRQLGGLTTDLFLDREQRRDYTMAKNLVNDVRSRIDNELLEEWDVQLPYGDFKLNPLRWKQFSLDADSETELQMPLLKRQHAGEARELTLNLGSSLAAPPRVDDIAVSNSDLPLILPASVERRKRGSTDPAITKFLLPTHQNPIVAPRGVLDTWMPKISEKIERVRLTYADVTGFARLMNPDLHIGLTMGVVHTALALSRSQGDSRLTEGAVEESLQLSVKSWTAALEKWSEVNRASTSIQDQLRASAPEQRQIYFYVKDHKDLSKQDIKYILFNELKDQLFDRMFDDMWKRGLVYEFQPNKYRAT